MRRRRSARPVPSIAALARANTPPAAPVLAKGLSTAARFFTRGEETGFFDTRGEAGGVFGVSGGVFGVSGSSIMVTFFCFAVALLLRVCSVTVPSASTEKVTGRAILYPVGALLQSACTFLG